MKIALLILIIIGILIFAGLFFFSRDGGEYSGMYSKGTANFPSNPVSVEEAVKRAQPYLNATFDLRKTSGPSRSNAETFIWVTLKDQHYYIVQDNYPSYSPGFYLYHAVKVDKESGAVIPPE